jgi:hypothetical protein
VLPFFTAERHREEAVAEDAEKRHAEGAMKEQKILMIVVGREVVDGHWLTGTGVSAS